MKKDSISAYVQMNHDTLLSLYASVKIVDEHLHSPGYVQLNRWTISQPKDK